MHVPMQKQNIYILIEYMNEFFLCKWVVQFERRIVLFISSKINIRTLSPLFIYEKLLKVVTTVYLNLQNILFMNIPIEEKNVFCINKKNIFKVSIVFVMTRNKFLQAL